MTKTCCCMAQLQPHDPIFGVCLADVPCEDPVEELLAVERDDPRDPGMEFPEA